MILNKVSEDNKSANLHLLPRPLLQDCSRRLRKWSFAGLQVDVLNHTRAITEQLVRGGCPLGSPSSRKCCTAEQTDEQLEEGRERSS